MTITARQQLVLDAIIRLTRENQAAPTIREIRDAMRFTSTNGVTVHLTALRKKGYIETPNGRMKSRGVRLLNPEFCPCCGQRTRKAEQP